MQRTQNTWLKLTNSTVEGLTFDGSFMKFLPQVYIWSRHKMHGSSLWTPLVASTVEIQVLCIVSMRRTYDQCFINSFQGLRSYGEDKKHGLNIWILLITLTLNQQGWNTGTTHHFDSVKLRLSFKVLLNSYHGFKSYGHKIQTSTGKDRQTHTMWGSKCVLHLNCFNF
jgi:hypothetical protein